MIQRAVSHVRCMLREILAPQVACMKASFCLATALSAFAAGEVFATQSAGPSDAETDAGNSAGAAL
jgi:hypothetical protein